MIARRGGSRALPGGVSRALPGGVSRALPGGGSRALPGGVFGRGAAQAGLIVAGILLAAPRGDAQAIGLCEEITDTHVVTQVSAAGDRVAVARVKAWCKEAEEGEHRTQAEWTSIVDARGKALAMFLSEDDPAALKAFTQKVGALARPRAALAPYLAEGGFKAAAVATEVASPGGCTARVVRGAPKDDDVSGTDDHPAYRLWLEVARAGKRLARFELGAGNDRLAAPAYAVHPVWFPARPGLAVDFQLTDTQGFQSPDDDEVSVYTRPGFAVLGGPALAPCFGAAPASPAPVSPASVSPAPEQPTPERPAPANP